MRGSKSGELGPLNRALAERGQGSRGRQEEETTSSAKVGCFFPHWP